MAVNPTPTPPVVPPVLQDGSFWITFITSLVAIVAGIGATAHWYVVSPQTVTAIDAAVATLVPIAMSVYVVIRGMIVRQALLLAHDRWMAHYSTTATSGYTPRR